jgi:GT2 family glycosyltransferase
MNSDKPIGIARMNCIKEVKTSIFAFIDDDIVIDEYWFNMLYQFMKDENIGAVCGKERINGLGILDKYIQTYDNMSITEITRKGRFNTSNCLIKTELVKDWVPTFGLNCYEDFDLGQHILNKGKKIYSVPSTAIHNKDFSSFKKSALWQGYEYKDAHKGNYKAIKQYIKKVYQPFYYLLMRGFPTFIYCLYVNFWFIVGMVKRELKR